MRKEGSKRGRGRDDGGARPSEGLLLPAFMSQDIYVLPREGVNARRAAATIHRASVKRERSVARRKKKRRNPRSSSRITTGPREITSRDSLQRYDRPATNKIETFVAIVRTLLKVDHRPRID